MVEQAKKLFVVEYSISRDTTRVRSVESMLKNNIRDIVKNAITDYVPVAMFATRAQAEMLAVEFRYHLEAEVLAGGHNWQHIAEVLEKVMNKLLND